MPKYPTRYKLEDEAHRHHLVVIGCGRLTKHTLAAHKKLICEAVKALQAAPPGDTVILEGQRDDVWLVIRSREDKTPRFCECCQEAARSHYLAGKRDKIIVAPGAHKPSPPGRT